MTQTLPAVAGRLAHQVAIVTGGGSRGAEMAIGRAVSLLLARAGALVAVFDADPGAAERTAQEIICTGGTAIALAGDVTDEAECIAAVRATVAQWGRLNVLVNNAGIGGGGKVGDLDEVQWHRVMDVNATGTFLMTKAALSSLADGGAVVNMSSAAVDQPGHGSSYAASKAAVEALTRATAAQYGPAGIRANCVSPGMVWSDMVARMRPDAAAAQLERDRRRAVNVLETEGTPWDVAYAVLFLASLESKWITGQVIRVDGGAPLRK